MSEERIPIGEKLSPILSEVEATLIEFEVFCGDKPNYTMEGFRAATKIFMSVLMDKMFERQDTENIAMKERCDMAQKCGDDLRKLVKTYTNIDTHELYK